MKGVFITFEGIEGSGKSTQIKLLADRLESIGKDVLVTREPGGTPKGTMIRKILLNPETGVLDPMTELLLFSAARRELVATVLYPALKLGAVVLCDRFADSTMAYQGYGRGMNRDLIRGLNKTVCGGIWPIRTIVLDLPVEAGLVRANRRFATAGLAESRFENERLDFHERVRRGFLALAEAEPARFAVINGASPKEEVRENIWDAVKGMFDIQDTL